MATITHTAVINAEPLAVWHLLRQFGVIDTWHPQIATCKIEGGKVSGDGGSLRTLELLDGQVIQERLLAIDNNQMTLTYGLDGTELPLDNFRATLGIRPAADGEHSLFEWRARFEAGDEALMAEYETRIGDFIRDGLDGLGERLGAQVELMPARRLCVAGAT
jgi:hypothetical protein